jgi:hypothetical protein
MISPRYSFLMPLDAGGTAMRKGTFGAPLQQQ